MSLVGRQQAPLSLFASSCEWCGAEAFFYCGNLVCGASYCSPVCQRADWCSGHRDVCQATLAWLGPAADSLPQTEIGGLMDRLLGRGDTEDSANKDGNFFKKMVGRYEVPEDQSDGVISNLLAFVQKRDAGEEKEDATDVAEDRLLTSVSDARQLKSNFKTAVKARDSEELWRNTKGGPVTQIFKEMREIATEAKERKLPAPKPLEKLADPTSNSKLFKQFFSKLAMASFKVSFATAKVAAGSGSEVAAVIGIPLDELIDAISMALDVMIFAATMMESIYGIIKSFVEIKEHLTVLLTFSGGPPGVQRAVDGLFSVLEKLGLAKRAQQFMGYMIELFDRFIRWAAPVIGSVIGLAIPYDAAITGRVVEFFLYPIKFFITKGWLLIDRLWGYLPEKWQDLLADREKWNGLMVSLVDLLKRLFPVDGSDTWKTRLIDKTRSMGLSIARFHPLVIVGVINREKLAKRSEQLASLSKSGIAYVDKAVSRLIDTLIIPNIDKISATMQAALGLGFGLIYMLYAYTPDGTRKKLGLTAKAVALSVDAIGCHLAANESQRLRFVADLAARHNEIRAIMCQPPTEEGMKFILLCLLMGVPLDPGAPYLGLPALAAADFQLYHRALF